MKSLVSLLLVPVLVLVPVRSQVRVPVPVLWMGPDSGSNRTLALVPALTLALEDLKDRPGLLRNHELQLHNVEHQCDVASGVKSLFELKWAGLEPLMLLGGACPSVTSSLSPVIPALDLVQVSFLAPPPPGSNRKWSGHMISTLPSDWALNAALVKLLQTLDWSRLGLVSQRTQRISQALEDLVLQLDQAQVQVLSSVRFSEDACSALRKLQDQDLRIFVALVEEDFASELFCCVHSLNLFGPQFQWLLLGAVGSWTLGWTRTHCSTQSLLRAADGSILIQVQGLRPNQGPGVSGRTSEDYERLYLSRLSSSGLKVAPLHGFVYDAVWLAALGLDRVLDPDRTKNRTETPQRDPELRKDLLLQALKTTSFTGVTGPVLFRGGQRLATLELTQFQGTSRVSVGQFNSSDQTLTLDLKLLRFTGGRRPRDRTQTRTETRHVTLELYVVTATASSLVVFISLGLVVLGLVQRRLRLDSWRSVPQEELLCLGVILCCVSVLVSGLDQVSVSDQTRTVLCSVHLWTLSVGQSVLFSVLFTEAWVQFSHCHRLPKSHLQSSGRLLCWILLLDVFVLSSWTVTDPLRRVETQRLLQVSSDQVQVWSVSGLCSCSQSELWITAVCGYKGPLLGLGLFVVWSLSPGSDPVVVSLKSGLSALSLFSALVVLAYASHDALLRFGLSSASVLIGCVSVLAAAFGPKLFFSASDVADPQKEAEQQKQKNRELRTKSLHLELEIDRLRRELFHPGSTDCDLPAGGAAEGPETRPAGGAAETRPAGGAAEEPETLPHRTITDPQTQETPEGLKVQTQEAQVCAGDDEEMCDSEVLSGRVSLQLPILHHSYMPVVGGVSASSSHASLH